MIPITAGMTGAEFLSAINNVRKEYNVKDYGAVGNNSTDDTVAIQAAINACITGGGGDVFFPRGIYLVGGALQRDIGAFHIDYKSQLYIPYGNVYEATRYPIRLIGEGTPIWGPNVYNNASSNQGSVIRSTLVNDVADAFVIASKGISTAEGGYSYFNYNDCCIENLQFRVATNVSGAVTIGGVGFGYASNALINRVNVYPYNIHGADTIAPINNAVGIETGLINCDNMVKLDSCSVQGFESGYKVGDHALLSNCLAWQCLYGFNFGANLWMVYGHRIESLWCKYPIYFSGAAMVKIDSINMEGTAAGKWYDFTDGILDASNQGMGEIYYHVAGTTANLFSKSGGGKLRCLPVGFAAASSFTVAGSRGDNEALASLLTKLAGLGIIIDSTT